MRLYRGVRTIVMAAAFAAPVLATVPLAHAGVFVGISVGFAPPVLPVYAQPPLPAPGYLWTPGYWAYGPAGYFWVPGVWVQPPSPGLLWTPAYWGFAGGAYGFHPGYWGPHVGFYGGVNYGFGYGGIGFAGGEWRGGGFFYNSAVSNFGGARIANVYENRTIVNNNTIINNNHVSYNGGPGGINRGPTPQEAQFAGQQHIQPTANQVQHQNFAQGDRSQLASVNHGRPGTMAMTNNAAYHQVAQQHAQTQPITAQDRSQSRAVQSSGQAANQQQRTASNTRNGQGSTAQAGRTNNRQGFADQGSRNNQVVNNGGQNQQRQQVNQQRQEVSQQQSASNRQNFNENRNGGNRQAQPQQRREEAPHEGGGEHRR